MWVTSLLGHKGQFLIEDDNGNTMFESCGTDIAVVRDSTEEGYDRELEIKSRYWSVTTGKHMAEFLKETHMMSYVDTLIANRVFRSLNDFLKKTEIMQVRDDRICVVYTNKKGELTGYKLDLNDY